jgi:hypothetical protein
LTLRPKNFQFQCGIEVKSRPNNGICSKKPD